MTNEIVTVQQRLQALRQRTRWTDADARTWDALIARLSEIRLAQRGVPTPPAATRGDVGVYPLVRPARRKAKAPAGPRPPKGRVLRKPRPVPTAAAIAEEAPPVLHPVAELYARYHLDEQRQRVSGERAAPPDGPRELVVVFGPALPAAERGRLKEAGVLALRVDRTDRVRAALAQAECRVKTVAVDVAFAIEHAGLRPDDVRVWLGRLVHSGHRVMATGDLRPADPEVQGGRETGVLRPLAGGWLPQDELALPGMRLFAERRWDDAELRGLPVRFGEVHYWSVGQLAEHGLCHLEWPRLARRRPQNQTRRLVYTDRGWFVADTDRPVRALEEDERWPVVVDALACRRNGCPLRFWQAPDSYWTWLWEQGWLAGEYKQQVRQYLRRFVWPYEEAERQYDLLLETVSQPGVADHWGNLESDTTGFFTEEPVTYTRRAVQERRTPVPLRGRKAAADVLRDEHWLRGVFGGNPPAWARRRLNAPGLVRAAEAVEVPETYGAGYVSTGQSEQAPRRWADLSAYLRSDAEPGRQLHPDQAATPGPDDSDDCPLEPQSPGSFKPDDADHDGELWQFVRSITAWQDEHDDLLRPQGVAWWVTHPVPRPLDDGESPVTSPKARELAWRLLLTIDAEVTRLLDRLAGVVLQRDAALLNRLELEAGLSRSLCKQVYPQARGVVSREQAAALTAGWHRLDEAFRDAWRLLNEPEHGVRPTLPEARRVWGALKLRQTLLTREERRRLTQLWRRLRAAYPLRKAARKHERAVHRALRQALGVDRGLDAAERQARREAKRQLRELAAGSVYNLANSHPAGILVAPDPGYAMADAVRRELLAEEAPFRVADADGQLRPA